MATDRPLEKAEPDVTSPFDASGAGAPPDAATRHAINSLPPGSFVTARFPESQVTDRYPEPRVTGRMIDQPPDPSSGQRRVCKVILAHGELVGDRYRVDEGPLPGATGEADIYRCADAESGDCVALKFYREGAAPKESVIKSLFRVRHPNLVTIRNFGYWQGRFYEVMDFCWGGSLIEHAPFDEPDLVGYLTEMLAGLQYLHVNGIVHRDIKPNNLLFQRPGRQGVAIGDFGVSSLLENGQGVRQTTTGAFFTLDYAAPELLDGKEVGPKTDYYALGITLLHLVTGQSPFAGLDKNTILGCHFRGKVPRPAILSKKFQTLIDGLLRVAPDKRWGYRQVSRWLRGELVMTDEGLPDREEVEVGKKLPYKNMTAITTPREMLKRLKEFNAEGDLQRGFISQWLMYFDTHLAKQVAKAEAEFADRPSLGVLKLRYLLDPTQPLDLGDHEIYNVEQLVKLIASGTESDRKNVQDALYSGCICVWLSALGTGDETEALVKRIESICARLSDRSLGVFALLYTLNPAQPLAFSTGGTIRTPEEIEDVLPACLRDVTRYLYYGYLREWLIAAFPQRERDIRVVTQIEETYRRKDEEQGIFALRCHFCHTVPLRLGAQQVESPKQLAALAGNDATFFHNAEYLLSRGWIRTWLINTGQLCDPAGFDELVNNPALSWPRKMEAVLHLFDPELPWPIVACNRQSVYADGVSPESCRIENIWFSNIGRGYLAGTVSLSGPGQGIVISGGPIEGKPCGVEIQLNGKGLAVGTYQGATLTADTNGGRLEIPVLFEVVSPLPRCLMRSVRAGLIAAGCMGVLRYALQFLFPISVTGSVMGWPDWGQIARGAYAPALIPLAILFLAGASAGIYFLYAMDRAIGETLRADTFEGSRNAHSRPDSST